MKKTILIITCFFIFGSFYSQCTVNASGFGNNTTTPMYNIGGVNSVEVVLNATNTSVSLNLKSNFTTAAGPDVKVYLVNPEGRTNAMLKLVNPVTLPNILFGNVSTSNSNPNGARSFTSLIPSGQNISNYTKIMFYCAAANAFWDLGTIVPFTSGNCATLSLSDIDESFFKVFPNPVHDNLIISLDSFSENLFLSVFTITGLIITENHKISGVNNTINVSNLASGIYIIEIKDDENKRFLKRFIKQ